MASQASATGLPTTAQGRRTSASGPADASKWLIYLVLIIAAVFALVPFLYTVSVSLMNLSEATGGRLLPSTPQWQNYPQAWNDASFSDYFLNSVIIAAITVSGEVVFCTLAAYAFARLEFPGSRP
jgi:multiple sugar transport system permease protein